MPFQIYKNYSNHYYLNKQMMNCIYLLNNKIKVWRNYQKKVLIKMKIKIKIKWEKLKLMVVKLIHPLLFNKNYNKIIWFLVKNLLLKNYIK